MAKTVKFQLSSAIVHGGAVRRPKMVIECTEQEAADYERRGKGKRVDGGKKTAASAGAEQSSAPAPKKEGDDVKTPPEESKAGK